MVNFNSLTPLCGSVTPRTPKCPDENEYTPRPLGGLITPPKKPKPKVPNRPLGGLITPNPHKNPDSPKTTRPVGGLITPKRDEYDDYDVFFPTKQPKKTENKKKVAKALLYTVGLAAAVVLGAKYSDKIKELPAKIKNLVARK